MLRNVIKCIPSVWCYRCFLLLGFVAISVLAVISMQAQVTVSSVDKVNHYIAFFYLSWCLDGSVRHKAFLCWKLPPLVGYAVLIEIIQLFLPYREFSYLDMLADGCGIATYWIFRNQFRRFLMW